MFYNFKVRAVVCHIYLHIRGAGLLKFKQSDKTKTPAFYRKFILDYENILITISVIPIIMYS